MGNRYPAGCERLPNYEISTVIGELRQCDFFLGLASGLTWLAWTLAVPTFFIEGGTSHVTMPTALFKNTASNPAVCRECFVRYELDRGKWDWCPDHSIDGRKFECTTTVTSASVIDAIKKYLIV